jgi:serine/threonine-protein kinase RsbT
VQEPADDQHVRLVHRIHAGDIEHGGISAAKLKRELLQLGVDPVDARRAGIIAFEAEINLMIYAIDGGTLTVTVTDRVIDIVVEDSGPGIEDIDLALTPGFSTAPDWATNLGFGAGMGLCNMEANADGFEIRSDVEQGTRILCRIERRKRDAA